MWATLLAIVAWLSFDLRPGGGREELTYSAFKRHVAAGEVTRVELGPDAITGEASVAATDDAAARTFEFHTEPVEDPDLVATLETAGVEIVGASSSPWLGMALVWLLPLALLVGVPMLLMRRMKSVAGEALQFGRSKAAVPAQHETGVTFDDVAGCDEAKLELREVVDFLGDPTRYQKLGAKIPKGVLLVGPPGTGKTLLARAVAGEAKVPFFSLSGSDFVEMFVGVGASRVRDLFEQAKRSAPCIVFIDELDAIGRRRGVHMGVVNDEREQTLNALLVELDGFEPTIGVILLAATNRPDVLDPALLRPGRFDRQVVLDAPDLEGRLAILRVHCKSKPMAPGVDLRAVAQAAVGFAGADLANAINEAALLAARRGGDTITQADLEAAFEKVVAGPERRSRHLAPEQRRRVAYHEIGHALAAHHSPHGDPIHKVSIVPRGHAALGYTMQLPTEEQLVVTKSELFDKLVGLLGGRAAEELVLGEPSTGASDDLRKATAIARQMIATMGMGERVGLARVAHPEGVMLGGPDGSMGRDCSEQTAREVDEEVRALLDDARARARAILEAHKDALERLATALLERETLDRAQFEALAGPPRRGDAT